MQYVPHGRSVEDQHLRRGLRSVLAPFGACGRVLDRGGEASHIPVVSVGTSGQ